MSEIKIHIDQGVDPPVVTIYLDSDRFTVTVTDTGIKARLVDVVQACLSAEKELDKCTQKRREPDTTIKPPKFDVIVDGGEWGNVEKIKKGV